MEKYFSSLLIFRPIHPQFIPSLYSLINPRDRNPFEVGGSIELPIGTGRSRASGWWDSRGCRHRWCGCCGVKVVLPALRVAYIFWSKFFPFSSCSKFEINSLMASTT